MVPPPSDLPNSSSGRVITAAAMTNPSSPVISAIFQARGVMRKRKRPRSAGGGGGSSGGGGGSSGGGGGSADSPFSWRSVISVQSPGPSCSESGRRCASTSSTGVETARTGRSRRCGG